jgi:hypothetical protein
MAATDTATVVDLGAIRLTEQRYPRYDPAHGTPDEMVRRTIAVQLSEGAARFEQTDYGHPGRFNPWAVRGIDPALQARTEELLAVCEAISRLLR